MSKGLVNIVNNLLMKDKPMNKLLGYALSEVKLLTEDEKQESKAASISYCFLCGFPEIEVYTPYFDMKTGSRKKKFECKNINCQWGCENSGGHQFKHESITNFLTLKAKRCVRCGDYDSIIGVT